MIHMSVGEKYIINLGCRNRNRDILKIIFALFHSIIDQDLLPALKEDLDKFAGNAPQFDDITMLCLEYKDRMIPADEESSGE